MSQAGTYEITVKIRVNVSDHPLDDPRNIAARYGEMSMKYGSIGATSYEVVEVKKVEDGQ